MNTGPFSFGEWPGGFKSAIYAPPGLGVERQRPAILGMCLRGVNALVQRVKVPLLHIYVCAGATPQPVGQMPVYGPPAYGNSARSARPDRHTECLGDLEGSSPILPDAAAQEDAHPGSLGDPDPGSEYRVAGVEGGPGPPVHGSRGPAPCPPATRAPATVEGNGQEPFDFRDHAQEGSVPIVDFAALDAWAGKAASGPITWRGPWWN